MNRSVDFDWWDPNGPKSGVRVHLPDVNSMTRIIEECRGRDELPYWTPQGIMVRGDVPSHEQWEPVFVDGRHTGYRRIMP